VRAHVCVCVCVCVRARACVRVCARAFVREPDTSACASGYELAFSLLHLSLTSSEMACAHSSASSVSYLAVESQWVDRRLVRT
jgi:hypothetical protein